MTPALGSDAAFDRVVIVDSEGRRELSPLQFFSLPLSQRIRSVIERTATFYAGAREVDRQSALDGLRRVRAAS